MNSFYRAAELDRPRYAPFLATLVPNGFVHTHALEFLSVISYLGLAGPSRWWIGDVRVGSVRGHFAHLAACSFDTGTYYRANGRPGPPGLGGGAGYTAYRAVLELVRGRWLLLYTTAEETSPRVGGPCQSH